MKLRCIYFWIPFYFSISFCNAQPGSIKPCIKVYGEVTKPLTLYADDLTKMNRTNLTFKDFSGLEYHYSGVALWEILKQAGGITELVLQGEDLAKYLLVKASDGSEVVFSLAEVNSNAPDQTIILADRMNDKPLPLGTGPFRIIIPADKKRTRWVWEVTDLVLLYAKE